MTTPVAPPIDLVTMIITLITLALGPELARLVGPYIVILFGALLGSAWSASRRETETRGQTISHLLRHVGLALLITVPSALAVAAWAGYDHKWLLGPVAALIGGIGHDWPRVGEWAVGLIRSAVETVLRRRLGGDDK